MAEATKATKPNWYDPVAAQQQSNQPQLRVLNSLTKEKVVFQPASGRQVKWYNCGPTVYDAAHLGHARNYVSQDIIRRILSNYFGYDVHFVMNITDIDDKIIIRARQNHLLDDYRKRSLSLTADLIDESEAAWNSYFQSKLSGVTANLGSGSPWDELVRKEHADEKWWAAAKASDEKFTMHVSSLRKGKDGIKKARDALATTDVSSDRVKELLDSTSDVLAPFLDAKSGSSLTDPSISRALAARWEQAFYDDMESLRVLPADTVTRVTEYVPEIVTFVEKIIDNGFAYVTSDGSVYFDMRGFDGAKGRNADGADADWNHFYAKLQPGKKGNKEALEEGEGALTDGATKRYPSDFALWKASKPGEPAWPSPWGHGRPGWHIECSVMASEIFGDNMDIHSGGIDLTFPHHDNELAQSEAHHNCRQWVNYFIHTGHLHIEGLKMSKSLKNFITVQEALAMYTARQLRLAFLGQLWSSPMDFKQSTMLEVKARETTFDNFFNNVKALVRDARLLRVASDGTHHFGPPEQELSSHLTQTQLGVRKSLCDSFNTPEALDRILDLISKSNVYLGRGRMAVNVSVVERVASWVTDILRMFGLAEGAAIPTAIGWGEHARNGESILDRESLLTPYLQALSTFRDDVRRLAISQASAKEILALCDKLRDTDLAPLGVQLDDQEDGRAMVKLVSPESLLRARDEKLAAAEAKAAKKAAAVEIERAKKVTRMEKGKIAPETMFRTPNVPEGTYSTWNDAGIPLTDGEGAELPKARSKKFVKEWEIQKKLHEEYLQWIRTEQ